MSFYDLAHERYSVRMFSQKAVEQEKLDRILEAGRVAPTAVNRQPQRILVVRGKDVERLKASTKYTFNAPVVLLIGYDPKECWVNPQGMPSGPVDVSIVTTTMMYAAWEVGLGSTWVGSFREGPLREAFTLPEDFVPVAMLPLGYPSDEARPHPEHHASRKPLTETVFYDSFD